MSYVSGKWVFIFIVVQSASAPEKREEKWNKGIDEGLLSNGWELRAPLSTWADRAKEDSSSSCIKVEKKGQGREFCGGNTLNFHIKMPVTVSYHTLKDKEKQTKAISAYNKVKESRKYS